MEEIFSLPEVQCKPPPESARSGDQESVEGTSFKDTLDEKIQNSSAEEQEQTTDDPNAGEDEAAASQSQLQIITVTNKSYDELITPSGEVNAEDASFMQDALAALSDQNQQNAAFDVEDLAVVSEDIQIEEMLDNDGLEETVKFSSELTKDITDLEVEVKPEVQNISAEAGEEIVDIEYVNVQTELQNAETVNEDTNQIEIDFNAEDLDSIELRGSDLKGMKMEELAESDRLAEALLPRIINRIIDNVKTQTDKGTTSIRIQLHPEELGKIGVRITVKDDGVHISLAADSNATNKLLQENSTALKQALAGAGVDLSSFDMGQGDYQSQANGKSPKGSGPRIHLINETLTPQQFPTSTVSTDSNSGLDYRI